MIQTYFTVKSADSGIPNSADGSREVLTNVPADNNLPEAGRTRPEAVNGQGRIRASTFSNKMHFPFRLPEADESPPMAMPATLPPPSPCKERVFYEPKEYSPGLQLYWASFARSLPDMAEALAHGAEVNWVNSEDDKRTPLMMAVQGVSADMNVKTITRSF